MAHRTFRRLIGLGTLGAVMFGGAATAMAAEPPNTAGSGVVAASVAAPSGEAMPVGDLPGWRQTFADDLATAVPLGSFPAAVSWKCGHPSR